MGNVLVNVRFDENGLLDLASDKVWTKVGTVNFDNDGLFGGKCAYTRKTGYFTSPVDERLTFEKGDFTISFWIKVLSYAGAGGMGVFGNAGPSYGDFFSTSGGYTQLCTTGVSGTFYRMTDLGLNEWRHVAIVRNNGIFNTYVDGRCQSEKADFINQNFNLGAFKHAILTSSYSGNIGYYPFDGYLDDFVILDHALWTEDFTPPNDYLADTLEAASSYQVIKKYQDQNGNELKPDETQAIAEGETYTATAPTIPGYKVIGYKIDGGTLIAGDSVILPSITANHTIIFVYATDEGGNGEGCCKCRVGFIPIIFNDKDIDCKDITSLLSCLCNCNCKN